MNPTMTDKELFRSDKTTGLELGKDSVDRVTATIGGASIIQAGVVKDGRFEIDQKTLKSIVKFGNGAKRGIKMRFGHPSMSDDALGTFLGRVKNFRMNPEETRVMGDLFFDPSSFHTPSGDLGGYLLARAQSDPESFGMSVVVVAEKEERRNKDGTPQKSEETGEVLAPLLRVQQFLGADAVDTPAATDGLFGLNQQTLISAEVYQHLEQLMLRPDFVKRAYVFLGRAMEMFEEEHSPNSPQEEPPMADATKTAKELETEFPNEVEQLMDQAVAGERKRIHRIVEFAKTLPFNAYDITLKAIDEGWEYFQAESAFLREERAQRAQEATQATGLKDDSQTKEKFATYQEAWQDIKRNENCSTQIAMNRAQDRYPKLYQAFLDSCPRSKK